MLFTIIKDTLYLINKDKAIPVTVNSDSVVKIIGKPKKLDKSYAILTLHEVFCKFPNLITEDDIQDNSDNKDPDKEDSE